MGGRGAIIQATKSSLFPLHSGSGLASTGVPEMPAPVAHSADRDPARMIPNKPWLPPCLSPGVLPSPHPCF